MATSRGAKRNLAALAVVLLLVVALAAVAVAAGRSSGGGKHKAAATTTTKPKAKLSPAYAAAISKRLQEAAATNDKTISIFATPALGDVLQQLMSAYKTAHADLTFEVTTGTSAQLAAKVQQGARPNLYIDDATAFSALGAKVIQGKPAEFGNDIPIIVVKRGNPKHVTGLNAFGSDPSSKSGVCIGDSDCAKYGSELLSKAKVLPIPDVEEADEATLVDEVATGNVDAGLVMRSASRGRFFKLAAVPLWWGPTLQVDYRIATLSPNANAKAFEDYIASPGGKRVLAIRGFLPLSVLRQVGH